MSTSYSVIGQDAANDGTIIEVAGVQYCIRFSPEAPPGDVEERTAALQRAADEIAANRGLT